MAVPALVGCRIIEPEIGAEIDELDAGADYRRRQPLAVTVRKSREDEVDAIQAVIIELVDRRSRISARQMRVDESERLPGLAVAEQLHRL